MHWARRQKTNPYPCLIMMILTVGTLKYLNIRCWKFDTDQFSRFWDIARWSQKLGAHYSGRCIYSAKYGTSGSPYQNWDTFNKTMYDSQGFSQAPIHLPTGGIIRETLSSNTDFFSCVYPRFFVCLSKISCIYAFFLTTIEKWDVHIIFGDIKICRLHYFLGHHNSVTALFLCPKIFSNSLFLHPG